MDPDDQSPVQPSSSNLKILFKDELAGPPTCDKSFVEIVVTQFTEATADAFENRMAEAFSNGQEFVIIRVHSPGGSVFALSRMLSCIESAKQAGMIIVTMCPGIAMSCGSILLAMGTRGYRFCSTHATILLHEISGGVKGTMTGMDNELAEYAFDNQNLFRKIARNAGLKDENFYYDFVRTLHRDLFLHPARVFQLKLVDHMFLPRLKRLKDQTYCLDYSGCKDPSKVELDEMIAKITRESVVLKLDVLSGVVGNPESVPNLETKKIENGHSVKKEVESAKIENIIPSSKAPGQEGLAAAYYGAGQQKIPNMKLDPTKFF